MNYWNSTDLLRINLTLKPYQCKDILDLLGRRFLSYQVNDNLIKRVIKEYLNK